MIYNDFFLPFLITLMAGLSTILGLMIFIFKFFLEKKIINLLLGLSAGLMIYLSFGELLSSSIQKIGFFNANVIFFCGILTMAFIDHFLPHHYFFKKISRLRSNIKLKLFSRALIITLGLTIHNFPEGIAVFLSSLNQIKFGVLLAFAIAIHNIPEGFAVAVSVYKATKNKTQAIKFTFVSAMAEPLGALFFLIFLKDFLIKKLVFYAFSFVAGVMVYISFDELLPSSFQKGFTHHSILGVIIGMLLAFISLILMRS